MRQALANLLKPLALAGLLTILTVGYALRFAAPGTRLFALAALGIFLLLFVLLNVVPDRLRRVHHAVLLAMPVVIVLVTLSSARVGAAQVLMVIWVACAFTTWSWPLAAAAGVLANGAFYLALRGIGDSDPLPMVLINMGFQALAATCVHYARAAEESRDALARVNADLLATRALLADSARDAERLRLARELHDVAGHKLTAMRLNLRELASAPALAGHPGLDLAERLSAELLGDLRRIVQSLRDDHGLDLATALRALAAPFPRPALEVAIAPGVRIVDPSVAEAVLRLAQEALTNAARHAGASRVWLRIEHQGDDLRIDIHDDGRCDERLREGNGIAGMRERLGALAGSLELGRTPGGGLRLQARLPA